MLENDLNLIPIEESKILFEEVMMDYYNKKYRTCICNLNSLLYLDLIKKLRELKNSMDDKKSKEILDTLEKMNNDDEQYSSCEKKLLELCRDKNIITKHFYEDSLNLRKIRNRCAHPAFSGYELFSPDKLEVAMYIDKLFNNLLILNSINYYNIVEYILNDIKDAYEKGISPDNKSLKNRVKRMFEKCDQKNMQKAFDSLFDLCIIKNDDDCKKYRDYTYLYLTILNDMSKQKDYYISKEHLKKINIKHLDEQYFTKNPYVSRICSDKIITVKDVETFNPEIKDLYIDFLVNSPEINILYNQIFDSFDSYVDFAISNDNSWTKAKSILDNFDESHSKKYFYKLLKKVIMSTPTFNSFDLGNYCLDEYCNNFKLLSDEERKELLLIMDSNSQIISSKKNHYDEYVKKITTLFGIENYDYLISSLKRGEENIVF